MGKGKRDERPGDQQSENSIVGGRAVAERRGAAAAGAGDAKVPFEDSYFPGSHGCHTRPPAILRLSLHCGNHNYTCGCLLIAARSPDPSRPTAAHPSRILDLLSSGSPLFQLRPRQETLIQTKRERIRRPFQRFQSETRREMCRERRVSRFRCTYSHLIFDRSCCIIINSNKRAYIENGIL